MKVTSFALSAMLSASALAYPGMGDSLKDFQKRHSHVEKRQSLPFPPALDASQSPVALTIKNILNNGDAPELLAPNTYVKPGPLGSDACKADQCCVWDSVSTDLIALFTESDGQCSEDARGAIRLGFHDAGAWSLTSGFGGADGSLLISTEEITRSENDGLQDIIGEYQKLWAKYKPFGVGAADLVQFGASLAALVCPLGPRTRVWLGRKDGDGSSPTGLLPDVNSDANTLISLFEDKTISAFDLAALIGAHSTSEQDVVVPSLAGAPQDSTPGVNDVLFYSETIDPNAPAEVFKFPSDVVLAADPRISPSFTFFGSDPNGQAAWNDAFARAYIRLSLLGVPNIDDLFECSQVLPNQVNSFVIPQPPTPPSNTTSSAPAASGSGKPYSSGNSTGAYPYTSNDVPYPVYSYPVTTSTVTKVKTYTVTNVKGSPTYSFSKYTTTTVCPVATAKKTETIPQGRFGPPGHYSYVPPVPSVTKAAVATASGLAYPTCVRKTVYTTVTVY